MMPSSNSRSASFVAVGDVYLNREDPGTAFSNIATSLEGGDIVFCNLEAPAADTGEPFLAKRIRLLSPPSTIPALARAGFNIVSFSNNHAFDYGESAFVHTLELLQTRNVQVIGAGNSIEEAWRPAIITTDTHRIAFLALTTVAPPAFAAAGASPGIAYLPVRTAYQPRTEVLLEQPGSPPHTRTWIEPDHLAPLASCLRTVRCKVDYLIVSAHWGIAFTCDLAEYQRFLAMWLVDNGADVVIGHHPHTPQGIEVYKGKVICYSLGNFIFDHWDPRASLQSLILQYTFPVHQNTSSRAILRAAILRDDGSPREATLEETKTIFVRLQHLSRSLSTDLTFEDGEIIVALEQPGSQPGTGTWNDSDDLIRLGSGALHL